MNKPSSTPTNVGKNNGWRGSRELWLDAAKQALLDSGLDAVKIQALAQRLAISRTSFYWFFKDRQALLEALLEEWEKKNTGAFITACEAYADSISEAILNLIVIFHDDQRFEPQLDFAVRGWAHQSDNIAARVNATDEKRLTAIRSLFERFQYAHEDADVRARTVYLTQIGYISLQVNEEHSTRMARVAGYVNTFCGLPPTAQEMARFYAAVKYDP